MENKTEIYFTIIPTKSGFTDQLTQFTAFYSLGSYLGYKYYHTDFKSRRSTEKMLDQRPGLISIIKRAVQYYSRVIKYKFFNGFGPDIFDALEINKYLRDKSANINPDQYVRIKIALTNDLLEKEKIFSFSELRNYIKNTLSDEYETKKLLVFTAGSGRNFLKLISSEISLYPKNSWLRDNYFLLRNKKNWVSKFDNKKLKILVHIRQGDTAVLKTPWGTYISLYSLYSYISDPFCELNDLTGLKSHRYINKSEYYSFVENLISSGNEDNYSLLFFSDGFRRAFNKLYLNWDKLKLSKEKLKMLMDAENDYDEVYFGALKDFRNSKLIIGESKKKFFDLIHAIFEANILIFGTQQSMVPRFIANYFDESNMPIVIVLYKKQVPKYDFLIGTGMYEKFIFVDVDNYDFNTVSKRINMVLTI